MSDERQLCISGGGVTKPAPKFPNRGRLFLGCWPFGWKLFGVNGRRTDGRPADERSAGGRKADGRTADGQTVGGRTVDGRTADERSEGDRTEGGRADGRTADGRTENGRRTDGGRTWRIQCLPDGRPAHLAQGHENVCGALTIWLRYGLLAATCWLTIPRVPLECGRRLVAPTSAKA